MSAVRGRAGLQQRPVVEESRAGRSLGFRRAFFRLAERLKKAFPHLRIMLLLDGLSASGPVISRCRDYGWQFMIVLQDASLPQVWQEYEGLRRLLGRQNRTVRISERQIALALMCM